MLEDAFCKTQTTLSKKSCDKHADKQHSIIIRAIRNEDIRDINDV